MSDEYRQKLLNWFTSVVLVLAASSLSPLLFWFVDLRDMIGLGYSLTLVKIAGAFSETMLLYPLTFPIVFTWHFFDFIEKARPSLAWLDQLTSFKAIFVTLALILILFVLMDIGFLQYNSCDELVGTLHWECIVHPSWWLMGPWAVAMIVALLLCIIKAVHAIRTLFAKPK